MTNEFANLKVTNLSLWESFYAVAMTQSIREAAKKLKTGVPAVSKKIFQLESELKTQLFHRTTRRLSLTPEAEELVPQVKRLLEFLQQLEGKNTDEMSGKIKIACLPTFAHRYLAQIICEFTKKHPAITFDIQLSDHLVDMIENQIDIAIRVQKPQGADFIYRKILTNKLVLCASPEYLAKNKKPLNRPEDLKHHKILSLSAYDQCIFTETNQKLSLFSESRKIICESGLFLTELALRGAGIGVRSQWDIDELVKTGKLEIVLKKFSLSDFGTVYAVTPPQKITSARVKAFLDFVSSRMTKS